MIEIKLGDRVKACVGSAGFLRTGTVTAVIHGLGASPSPQYFVHFAGDHGHSGPCHYPIKLKEEA